MKIKCENCKYKKYYGKNIFPCIECNTQPPVTCEDCKYAFILGRCKKGLRTCKKFEWS